MKQALLFFFLRSTVTLIAADPWPGVQYSEVRAYAWPANKGDEEVIKADMTPKPGVINEGGAVLTAVEVKQLMIAVTGKHPSHPVAMCHIPHNAFVFYNADKKPVAFVEICFGCLSHRIEPAGSAPVPDLIALASIFAAHKLPIGEYPDVAAFKKHFEEFNHDEPLTSKETERNSKSGNMPKKK